MIELLRERRSIRTYADEPVETDKIEILKEALLRSPSSKNINPWEFIFISDRSVIAAIKGCKPDGVISLESAPLAVVICADETKNDVWIEDCAIASTILQLTAISLGLGSCWIQVRNRNHNATVSAEDYIRDLLSIPPDYRVLNIIALGYAAQIRKGKTLKELQPEKIRLNKF